MLVGEEQPLAFLKNIEVTCRNPSNPFGDVAEGLLVLRGRVIGADGLEAVVGGMPARFPIDLIKEDNSPILFYSDEPNHDKKIRDAHFLLPL